MDTSTSLNVNETSDYSLNMKTLINSCNDPEDKNLNNIKSLIGKARFLSLNPETIIIPDSLFEDKNPIDTASNHLTASISRTGIIHPIIVSEDLGLEGPTYTLVTGLRRLNSAKKLSSKAILCMVIAPCSEGEKAYVKITENYHRKKLLDIDLCINLKTLNDEGYSPKTIAHSLGLSPETVKRMMRIGGWPKSTLDLIRNNPSKLTRKRLLYFASLRQDHCLLFKLLLKAVYNENDKPLKIRHKLRIFAEEFVKEKQCSSITRRLIMEFIDKCPT